MNPTKLRGVIISLAVVGVAVGLVAFLALGSTGAVSPDGQVSVAVEPLPAAVRSDWKASLAEIDKRVQEWAEDEGASHMSPQETASAMDQLTAAITNRDEGASDGWLALRELFARRQLLCERLPADHEYRGGEYCS